MCMCVRECMCIFVYMHTYMLKTLVLFQHIKSKYFKINKSEFIILGLIISYVCVLHVFKILLSSSGDG